MSNSYRITIPEPCSEDWNKMLPAEKGRFCLSCAKTVVDFRNYSKNEIQDYFKIHQGEKTCGRFKITQLQNLVIEIPFKKLQKAKSFRNIFKLSLFIVFGTTLFSCSNEKGEKVIIEKVVIKENVSHNILHAADSLVIDGTIIPKMSLIPPIEISGDVIEEPVVGIIEIEPPKNEINGGLSVELTPVAKNPNAVFSADEVTQQAELSGLHDYLRNNFHFQSSDDNFQGGTCYVEFIVEKDGSITQIQLKKGTSSIEFNEAALNVVRNMPRWSPARYETEAVRAKMILPVKYTLKT